ncbi:B3/4 domain-containing protein [Kibdelosporangium phytohabitans]|uniref:tRNA synthetase subunit beta n=1 Tax=Kibdelosporangium phytohabitans TaxID=860235 RepID=A0A0N9I074_9PSEU|nr:phenylalanine--tRNA ligase beta subunit-related protein [Kibdelosporangium phytohabitans]ALG13045.1 tRNA synthetase subunit beta [Kibdelosporangium phytohabitans]MBE1464781.1 DNA/RNA-binding domain of Phe-tRNA-synthetase-like protein [Kibdelosporangium phytohabitans]
MRFSHSPEVWRGFPALVSGVLATDGITPDTAVADRLAPFHDMARARLAESAEGEFPETQAWRRAFSAMGLKPTQYRCASESLLRRFRKEGALPSIHPLIDLCNAVSLAYAVPIAVFDVAHVADFLEVRPATGTETYTTFAGAEEHPEPGEIVFADASGTAHARRWTNRQAATSAIRDTTSSALIVAEALHDSARGDIESVITALADELAAIWSTGAKSAILSADQRAFEY